MVGSTRLSTRVDPEELRDIISTFQSCCKRVTESFGGHVARYMGDGMLVYFGYPKAHENDPELAVRAGLEVINCVNALEVGNDLHLQTRVGIATGEVVVGDLIGAGSSRERSVIGETPNLAARLQSLAEPDGVVVSSATHRLVGRFFEFTDLGEHHLAGFDSPVGAWQVDAAASIDSRFDAIHQVRQLTPLVSRTNEVDKLMERWTMARNTGGQAVLISGEPGIGKSRLVHTLRERMATVPYSVVRYFCVPIFQNTALYPVIREIEASAGFEPGDDSETKLNKLERHIEQIHKSVADLAPFLAKLLSLPAADRYPQVPLSPQLWMERTLRALESRHAGMTRDQPMLMIFEDLHWVDPTSLELLRRTVENINKSPLLLVMTARPEFNPPWRESASVTSINLHRLSGEQSAALATQVMRDTSLPASVVRQIVKKADGIPLFVEELTKTIVESDWLANRGGEDDLEEELTAPVLPDTLQDMLMARLDGLSEAKEIAQIGATIGRSFSYELLMAVTGSEPDKLNDAIDKLLATDLVSGEGNRPNATYTFRHVLIQDSAYSSLLKKKRMHLHGRIARALEQQFPDIATVQPETLAHHFTRAGDSAKAIEHWHQAAIRATDKAAHKDAVEHVNRAIKLLSTLPPDADLTRTELGLRITLGRNLEATLGYADEQVERTFDRAKVLCEQLGETTEQVPVLLGLCVFNLVRAECRVTRELAETCVQLSEQGGNSEYLIESYAVLAYALCYLGEQLAAREIIDKCLHLYEQRGDEEFVSVTAQNPGIAALSTNAILMWQLGYADSSLECIERALALATKTNRPIDFTQIHTHAAELYQLRGEPELARQHAKKAIEIAEKSGYDYWRLLSLIHLGIANGMLGDNLNGLATATAAMDRLSAAGAETNLTYFLAGISQIHAAAGSAEKGLTLLNRALDQAELSGERFHIALLYLRRGECRLQLSEPDTAGAIEDFEAALRWAEKQEIVMLELHATCRLVEVHDSSGYGIDRRTGLRRLLDGLTEGMDTVDVQEARRLLQ
ncbi:MAG: AAA family ATPase [Woeseiaceae bacterium]